MEIRKSERKQAKIKLVLEAVRRTLHFYQQKD